MFIGLLKRLIRKKGMCKDCRKIIRKLDEDEKERILKELSNGN